MFVWSLSNRKMMLKDELRYLSLELEKAFKRKNDVELELASIELNEILDRIKNNNK